MSNPSNAKKLAVALFLCWFASYLERFLINMALPFIGSEYHFDEAQLGLLLSVFFVGYSVVQLPGGWLADRFGSRAMIILSIAAFTIMSATTGLAWSVPSLFVVRFLFGLLEGCFPTAAYKVVSEGYPKAARARVQAVMLATNPISLALAPLMAVPLIMTLGWRGMFLIASLVGLIALLAYSVWGRTPAPPPGDDRRGTGATAAAWSALLRDRNIWKISIINFGVNILIWGFLSWIPTYMLKVLKLDLVSVGFIAALPGIAGFVGILLGGWLADEVFDGREKHLLVISILLASASLVLMLNATALPLIVLCQVIIAACVKVAFIGLWALPLKLIEADRMGAASGIVNLGSQLAGVASPSIMGFMIVMGHGSYVLAFTFLAVCSTLSAGVAMTLQTAPDASAGRTMGGARARGLADSTPVSH